MADKRYGLKLTDIGAPTTPHVVSAGVDEKGKLTGLPIPGFFFPHVPTPVGGEDDPVSLKEARAIAKASDAVELVELNASEAKDAETLQAEIVKAARENLPDAAAVATGAETSRVNDEKVAAGAGTEKE